MRKIKDLVFGKPSNREGLWAMTNKQASGIGHMSNMVLEHVGGAARHCIVCTFFCVSSFLSQVFIGCGLVTAVSWRWRSLPVEIGRGTSAACTAMVHWERTADWFEDGTRAVQTRGASRRCLVSSACCGMDAGAATAAMRENDRDEDLGSF
jgi:hypothetical protein